MSLAAAKQWWSRQHTACKESCILLGIALCALISLIGSRNNETEQTIEDPLLRSSASYRINSANGNYTLLFSHTFAHIGNNEYQVTGRLKASEAHDIKRSLEQCALIRDLGMRQLDLDQQAAYGLNDAVVLSAPGQETWTIATGIDQKGYALNQEGRLFTLDRDLAAQLRRSPAALRDNTLGIPHNCTQVTAASKKAAWKINKIHEHWWLDLDTKAQLIDQNIFKDWLHIFTRSQAVSFTELIPSQQYGRLVFIGSDQRLNRQITLIDRGHAPASSAFRIIERQEKLENQTLSECFIIDVDKDFFQYPAQAFLSKQLIPFDTAHADEIQINDLHAKRKNDTWILQPNIAADQAQVQQLLSKLNALPNHITNTEQSIGTIREGSLKFQIPTNQQTSELAKSLAHYKFVDPRILPNKDSSHVSGLVIQRQGEAPQLFQKNAHGEWDLDPETHAEIKDFIEALSAARVRTWTSSYNANLAWTSTLTLAIGESRLVIQKTDEHFIGIKAYNAQGYLDQNSIKDLFGE